MQRTLVYIVLVAFLAGNCLWASGDDKDKGKKKKKTEQVVTTFEPDPIPTGAKARPDIAGADIDQPTIFGGVRPRRNYPTGLQGIDVSHYQHTIDWKAASKDKNVGFAYIKATEGDSFIDDMYYVNFQEARKHKVPVGSYHFFRPGIGAQAQYDHFISTIDIKHQNLLPLVDVETMSGVSSISTMHARLLEFCRLLTQAFKGKKPLIYTGKNFYNSYFAGYPQFKEYKFMIAQYSGEEPVINNGYDDYLIWQYSSKGRISGINGNVDRSCFVGGHTLNEILIR